MENNNIIFVDVVDKLTAAIKNYEIQNYTQKQKINELTAQLNEAKNTIKLQRDFFNLGSRKRLFLAVRLGVKGSVSVPLQAPTSNNVVSTVGSACFFIRKEL